MPALAVHVLRHESLPRRAKACLAWYKRRMAKLRFAALFALAFGFLHAQDTQVVTLPAPPPGQAGQSAAQAVASARATRVVGLLWKATSATTTVYLAGSLHFGSQDMYPLPDEMEAAFERSSILVVELDPSAVTSAMAGALMSTGMYPPSDSLWNHVSERTRSLLPGFAAERGLNAEMLARFKPWAASLVLSAKMLESAGMRTELGIDVHFLDQARGSKRIEELETAEEQIQAFSGVPERELARSIEKAVTDPGHTDHVLHTMRTAWLNGDAAGIEGILTEDARESPETQKRLIDDRNVRMAAAAERYLHGSEPCFVVVGAGHLVGKGGVVSRLAAKGFSVKQVKPAAPAPAAK